MELLLFIGIGLFIVYYLFRPTSKIEEKILNPRIIGEVDFSTTDI